uniref:Uncharacterized protein n=1 Tax=uncultured Armatimonadetes bacterium TaxID=157466 RepID=A0A6J4HWJ8_9BACT|nr:hypothetical protein AVDCRST_MAG63-1144 [uncultured Armatimonadetes bacterium]
MQPTGPDASFPRAFPLRSRTGRARRYVVATLALLVLSPLASRADLTGPKDTPPPPPPPRQQVAPQR